MSERGIAPRPCNSDYGALPSRFADVDRCGSQELAIDSALITLLSVRRVDLIVTELAVIQPTEQGLLLREIAPGVTVEDVRRLTEATLLQIDSATTMPIE